MPTAFIIHASNSSPERHWYPWLRSELAARGWNVIVPHFPTGDAQTLKNWTDRFSPYKAHLQGSVMIGHSLGVAFLLNVLNNAKANVGACYLVSGFVGELKVDGEPNLEDFSMTDFDWEKIKQRCSRFYVLHSDNDPYVPKAKAKELAEKLETKTFIVSGAGHFTEPQYRKFPLLLNLISSIR